MRILCSNLEPLDEHLSDQNLCVEIVERDAPSHKPKTWRQWFKDPKFYAVRWSFHYLSAIGRWNPRLHKFSQ